MKIHIDFRPIIQILGLLLMTLACVMMVPAMVEAAMIGVTPIEFILSALITGVIGTLFVIATRDNRPISLSLKQASLLTSLSWIILPAFAALPMMGMGLQGGFGLSYTDAVFEAVSGLTTTGSTVITGLDNLLPGLLLWRSLLNWIGGIGIIVMAIIMLPFLRIGGMQLFRMESSDQSEKMLPKSNDLLKNIAGIYLGLTVLCAVGYKITGMTTFDAINHAMATLATGGFSTHDSSFGYYGYSAQWVGIIFMLAGSLPFIAFMKLIRGDKRVFMKDMQIKAYLYFLGIVIVTAALLLSYTKGIDPFSALTMTAFNIISVVTTTGFASTDYSLWGTGAVAGFFLLTFVGGCAGSTSGAIKIYRFQVLWITVREQIGRLISPHKVVILHYQGAKMPNDLPISVLAFLAVFFSSIAVVTGCLAAMGIDFLTALTAASTALTNVGPGLGDIIGPAGNFATLDDGAKWILSFTMILGRLEIFTLIMLFDPTFWRD